jgi:hypothetical protein
MTSFRNRLKPLNPSQMRPFTQQRQFRPSLFVLTADCVHPLWRQAFWLTNVFANRCQFKRIYRNCLKIEFFANVFAGGSSSLAPFPMLSGFCSLRTRTSINSIAQAKRLTNGRSYFQGSQIIVVFPVLYI